MRGAIEVVRPFGIDLCSGVLNGGQLDPYKLVRFFKSPEKREAGLGRVVMEG